MAYGNKYKIVYSTLGVGTVDAKQHTLYIKEWDYTGAIEDLKGTAHGIVITYKGADWENYIIGANCEFDIINEKDDYFELLDLMFAVDKKYQIFIGAGFDGIIFEGFINVEAVEQKYLKKQTIRLVASSYLNRLEFVEFPFSMALTTLSFIDIIDGILRSTGIERDIWVSHSWRPEPLLIEAGKTLFNTTGIFLETFWENNVEKQNGYEILSSILKTFNCYLFYEDGHWSIVEYFLMWEQPRPVVIYTTGQSYNPTSVGVVDSVTTAPIDVNNLIFTGQSQLLTANPGYKQIEIKTDLVKFDNLVLNDFSQPASTNITNPVPLMRHWLFFREFPVFTWTEQGQVFNTIENSAKRVLTEKPRHHQKGLYTTFEVTIDDNSSLQLKWKRTIAIPSFIIADWDNITELEYKIRSFYYLRILTYLDDGQEYYIKFIKDDNYKWFTMSGSAGGGLNEIINTFNKEQIDDLGIVNEAFFIDEISQSIPISEVNEHYTGGNLLRGNHKFVLGIGVEAAEIKGKLNGIKFSYAIEYFPEMWIGDIFVTTSGETPPDNLLKGEINIDFVNTKKINLEIGDIPNVNYKNGILMDYAAGEYKSRTENWTRPNSGVLLKPLDEIIMMDKFRLYYTAKQHLSGIVLQNTKLNILQMFTDINQPSKKYILMGLIYKPTKSMYEVQLLEYDNTTDINLLP